MIGLAVACPASVEGCVVKPETLDCPDHPDRQKGFNVSAYDVCTYHTLKS